MLFTSPTFLIFLFTTFYVYWRLENKYRNGFLLIANYLFYAWWDYRFVTLILLLTVGNYWLGNKIFFTNDEKKKKHFLYLSLLLSLGVLGWFKYFNFFLGIWAINSTLNIILPVGISFYTFQMLSYVIDIYRGELKVVNNPLDFFVYSSFFPQILSGPIGRAKDLLWQFSQSQNFKLTEVIDGCQQIIWGLFKKVVIANSLAIAVGHAYGNPLAVSGAELALATFFFAFQLYADFSGYSDIAIGAGKLFGINLSRNFAYPYFSRSIAEFWRRWHMSLSFYIRDYFYFPLIYSKKYKTKSWLYFSVILTFVLIGLWHGAAWKYVVMGLIFGCYLVVAMIWQDLRRKLIYRAKA